MSKRAEPEQYIVFKGWSDFQHYGTRANVAWIKNYTALLKDDAYLELPLPTRGLLHSLWLLNATTTSPIPTRTSYISRALGQRVLTTQLKLLNQAGFIEFVASKELARRKQLASKPLAQKKNPSGSSKSARAPARAGLRAAPEDTRPTVYRWQPNGNGQLTNTERETVADQAEAEAWIETYAEAGQVWTLTPHPPENG